MSVEYISLRHSADDATSDCLGTSNPSAPYYKDTDANNDYRAWRWIVYVTKNDLPSDAIALTALSQLQPSRVFPSRRTRGTTHARLASAAARI